MIDRDIALLLIGACIAIISSVVTAVIQHFLTLRADRIKHEQVLAEQKAAERKQSLASGKTLAELEAEITKVTKFLSIGVEETVSVPEDTTDVVTGLDEVPTELPQLNLRSDPIKPLDTSEE